MKPDFVSNNLNLQLSLEELMPLIKESLSLGRNITFTPRGISMLPMLRNGEDTVTLSPLPQALKKYDIILYKRDNGKYVLHRIIKTGDTYTCIGDNQFVKELGVESRQIVGVVTRFTRCGKEYSVTDFGYRLYCRFWHYSRFLRRCVRAIWRRVSRFFQNNTKN